MAPEPGCQRPGRSTDDFSNTLPGETASLTLHNNLYWNGRPTSDQPTPITNIPNGARSYSLTGLANYTFYGVTPNAMLGGVPILTDTVTIMPTGILVHLPAIYR